MGKKIDSDILSKIISLKKKGFRIADISSEFNLSDNTILKYTKHIPHPNRKFFSTLPEGALGLSNEKAEILGYLCSEGSDNNFLDRYNGYDKRRNRYYLRNSLREWINFTNMDKTLQSRFIYLMNYVYDYPLKVYNKGSFCIRRKIVVKDLRDYTIFGSRRWNVPKSLFENNFIEQTKFFIRAYLDGDGTVDIKKKAVIVDSVNLKGLKNVNKLFNKFGIKTKFYVYKSRCRIVSKDVKKYNDIIGFVHPKKNEKMNFILNL